MGFHERIFCENIEGFHRNPTKIVEMIAKTCKNTRGFSELHENTSIYHNTCEKH